MTEKDQMNRIQFSFFYTAQYHKLQISLRGLYNLYTYDIRHMCTDCKSKLVTS